MRCNAPIVFPLCYLTFAAFRRGTWSLKVVSYLRFKLPGLLSTTLLVRYGRLARCSTGLLRSSALRWDPPRRGAEPFDEKIQKDTYLRQAVSSRQIKSGYGQWLTVMYVR